MSDAFKASDTSAFSNYLFLTWQSIQGECPYFSDHSGCDYTYAINLNDLEKYGLTVHTFDDFECRRTKHQALDWFGDINGDSIPDFIFNHLTTYASFDHLYISEKIEDKVSYKKVNWKTRQNPA